MLVCSDMRSAYLVTVLLLGLLFFPLSTATEGRAPPQCASLDLSAVVSSSTGVSVEPGACVIIDIGTRSYTTTLGFDIEVLDDAMDVLLFDQSSIQSYQNGQNYRSSFNKEVSFESMIGAEWLDWAPPQSISPKNWYLVFDNSAHDGDEGMGARVNSYSCSTMFVRPGAVSL